MWPLSESFLPHRSRGYHLAADGKVMNCGLADISNKIPGGGFVSTASDLLKFALAVNFFIDQLEGHKRVRHSGGQQGITTNVALLADQGVVVAVMLNLDQARVPRPMTDGILRVLLEE